MQIISGDVGSQSITNVVKNVILATDLMADPIIDTSLIVKQFCHTALELSW